MPTKQEKIEAIIKKAVKNGFRMQHPDWFAFWLVREHLSRNFNEAFWQKHGKPWEIHLKELVILDDEAQLDYFYDRTL